MGDVYKYQTDLQRLQDSLWVLWYCFRSNVGKEVILGEFADAYVYGKTITRSKPRRRTVAEDIHTGLFVEANLVSQRVASEPRDYIYATMPPFPWYEYPTNAENISFGELFVDLYNQATQSKHTFAPKITASMIQSNATDTSNSWLPSTQQPEPQCLGDFLKLLGQRLATETPNNVSCFHVTTAVRVLAIHENIPLEFSQMIQSAIRFCEKIWKECHIGGELSKYGSYPDSSWEFGLTDAASMGWWPDIEKSKGPHLRFMEDGDQAIFTEGPSIEYKTLPDEPPGLGSIFLSSICDHDVDYVPILEYSRSILDSALCASDRKDRSSGIEYDHDVFLHEMKLRWSKPLLNTLALLTAMVNCQIGLSAARWVRKYFVPALIQYDKDNKVLGLLAKHTCSSGKFEVKEMMSVGRHLHGPSIGKDLVLVDLALPNAPIGIIPDFGQTGQPKEEFEQRMRILYRGLGKYDDSGNFEIAGISPESYAAKLRMRMQENLAGKENPDSDGGVLIPQNQCAPRGLLSKPLGLTLSTHKHSFSIRCLQLIWSKEDGLFQCSASYSRPAAKSDDYARIFKAMINP